MATVPNAGKSEATPDRGKPPAFLVSSIFVTILCLPFGLVAIGYGVAVHTRWRAGDQRGADHASDMAEKWMYGGIGAAFLVFVGWLIWWAIWGRHTPEYGLGI